MPTLEFKDFSGGLNLRDSPAELASNETPLALNWTLDQRGALRLRNGCTTSGFVALPGVSGKPAYIFYSAALDQWLCIRETAGTPNTLKLHTHGSDLTTGSWTDRGTISVALTALVGFADWPGTTPIVVIGGFKEIFTWNGTTLTQVETGLVGGGMLCVWQNRVWTAGYPVNDASGHPCRLYACKVGDPTVWSGTDLTTVDLRENDAAAITALGVAGGALHVFKRSSAYRVADSSTGAYSTIDPSNGCLGPFALVTTHGGLVTWGLDSLYAWDGIGHGQKIGDKCRPLFATDAAIGASIGSAAASWSSIPGGLVEDRCLFAYPFSVGGVNSGLLEYDPQHGWLMKHTLPGIGQNFSSFARKGKDLYAAQPNNNQIWKVFSETPGADGGTAWTNALYRTPWLKPNGGKRCRVQRAQVDGLLNNGGFQNLTFNVLTDWSLSSPDAYDLSADLRSSADQATSILRSLGQGDSFAFQFSLTGTIVQEPAVVSALALDVVLLER